MMPSPTPLDNDATRETRLPEAALLTLARTRHFDRLMTLEHLTAHLAHQLGSPLNVIEGRAALVAASSGADDNVRRHARIIGEQSARIVRVLSEVVAFCRRGTSGSTDVDLAELTRSAVSTLAGVASEQHATISLDDAGAGGHVRGDADELLVALTHLLENGIRATPPGGTLHVRLRRVAQQATNDNDDEGPELCVDVDDDGPGIATSVLTRLFEPFATTHGVPEACGLGLFVAQAIAKDHGGWLEGVNNARSGARFTLHLPQGTDHVE